MRILVVGAGSIGQLYGHILQQGGAEVGVYVRPKYVDDARQGYLLYDRKKGFSQPERFSPDAIHSSPDELTGEDYDAVLFCVPSTGLRGDWLEPFCAAIGDATLITLTPGLDDRKYICERCDVDQLGVGVITAISYPAPLPGEEVDEPGTAYWFPPMTPAIFDGPREELGPLVDHLKAGGMNARFRKNLEVEAAYGAAVVNTFVAALEMVDWSFDAVKSSGEHRKLIDAAWSEAMELIEARFGEKPPLPLRFLGPMTLRGGLMMAPVVPPFDLETYLKVHFTKVGEQTRMTLDTYISARSERDWESPALSKIRHSMG